MTTPQQELYAQSEGLQYNFGPFCLRPDGTLLRESAEVPLPPKELAILRLLVLHAGQIVSAQQLHETAWGNVHVSADSLPRSVSSLRAHLESEDCIQTVYKRGYRLRMPVMRTAASEIAETRVERRIRRSSSLPRLAILPLTTGAEVPEFLGPGIAEETMLRLGRSRTPIAEIMSRDSVFALVARGMTAHEVGKALRADLILTGSITALPLHFRLRVELVRVRDAVQLWIEDFLVPRNLLAYTDARIAKRITARIRNTFANHVAPVDSLYPPALLSLTTGRSDFLPRPCDPPVAAGEATRSEAYTTFLRARDEGNTLERHPLQNAVQGFQHAVELDANLLPARLQLIHGYLTQSYLGYLPPGSAAEMALKQADILHAHPSFGAPVQPALGWIHFHHDRDLAAATVAFGSPQRLGYDPWSLLYRVRFALGQGNFAEALVLLRSALEADPYSPELHAQLAWALYLAGESTAALEQARRNANLFPDHPLAMLFACIIFAAAGGVNGVDEDEMSRELTARATSLALRLTQIAPTFDPAAATLAYVHARQGRIVEARALLDRQQWLSRERYVMGSFHAAALVELGEYDAAVASLARAEEQRCPWLFELLRDPRLQPLHCEPEFQRLGSLSRETVSEDASVA